MVRRPNSPNKIKETVSRNRAAENLLCEAIRNLVLVEIIYDDDVQARLFQPSAVYFASTDNVNLTGIQIHNPAKPMERNKVHVLTVGKIRSVSLTAEKFTPDPAFDPLNPMYRNGFICRI